MEIVVRQSFEALDPAEHDLTAAITALGVAAELYRSGATVESVSFEVHEHPAGAVIVGRGWTARDDSIGKRALPNSEAQEGGDMPPAGVMDVVRGLEIIREGDVSVIDLQPKNGTSEAYGLSMNGIFSRLIVFKSNGRYGLAVTHSGTLVDAGALFVYSSGTVRYRQRVEIRPVNSRRVPFVAGLGDRVTPLCWLPEGLGQFTASLEGTFGTDSLLSDAEVPA